MSSKPIWHHMTAPKVLEQLQSSVDGLEVSQVTTLREKYGLNALPTKKIDPWWMVLVRQFASPLIIVLLVAAGVTIVMNALVDTGVILAAVFINTIIGFFQEYKASRALEQLRSLVQPIALVLRDGQEVEVDATQLVPGDILIIKIGDRISADARLVEVVNLVVNESALTGESLPVTKELNVLPVGTLLAERSNILYAGTTITAGRGLAVVIETGVNSELGKIAELVQNTEETSTPLQVQLKRLARWISVVVCVLVAFVFLLGLLKGFSTFEMFEVSVALAVAAIPEGLVVAVTVILAIGMQRILKRKSLVRRLVAAETLGSVSVICSDKTGTITEGEMRVTDVVSFTESYLVRDLLDGYPDEIKKIIHNIALCNDADLVACEDGMELKGSPTERALMRAVIDLGIDVDELTSRHKRTAEIPFDSSHKFMLTANDWSGGSRLLFKGAPGIILKACDRIRLDGKSIKMTDEQRKKLVAQVDLLTQKGLRIIATAYKQSKTVVTDLSGHELSGYTFSGFIGLRDPLRKEARQQIRAAERAGVKTIIITGDHPQTAKAIGIEAGLSVEADGVVIGSQLDEWSDSELERRVSKIQIYARVEPRHKIRIVKAWQARGEVVAMTGDGVNDAPALKAADIGVALGSGTEVAKQAADVVLLNNDLGTITAAIEEGRIMFDNIRKSTVYLLAGSFSEISLIAGSIALGLPLPITATQILWINLFADSFPGAGLTMEPGEKGVMRRSPRPRKEAVLNSSMIKMILSAALILNIGFFALYFWLLGQGMEVEQMQSIMFAAVSIDSLLFIFSVRKFHSSIFRSNPFSNPYLVVGVGMGFGLMFLALLHPFFQYVFHIMPLSLSHWLLLLIIGMVKLIAIEIAKEVFILRSKH